MNTLSVSITLLTLLLSVYFLAKTKSEYKGTFFRVASYLIFSAAVVLFVFQLVVAFSGWGHHNRMYHMGNHRNNCINDGCAMHHFNKDCHSFRNFDKQESRKKDKNKIRKKKRIRNTSSDSTEVYFESTTDTIDGKIIKKEIEIIKN